MQEIGKTIRSKGHHQNALKVIILLFAAFLASSSFSLAQSLPGRTKSNFFALRPLSATVKIIRSEIIRPRLFASFIISFSHSLPQKLAAARSVSRDALESVPTDIASTITAVDRIPEITLKDTQIVSPLALFSEFEVPSITLVLPKRNNTDVVLTSAAVREIEISGAGLTLAGGVLPSRYVPRIFSQGQFSLANKSALGASLFSKIPRLAQFELLPVKQMLLAKNSNMEESAGMVLGASTTADALALADKKPTIPFLDRISLSLYCALSSKTSDADKLRCNYDAHVLGLVNQDAGLSSNAGTSPTSVTATSSIPKVATPAFTGQGTPTYITRYITQYIQGVPGKDGQNGRDGKDSSLSATVNNVSVPSGFGSYVIPSYTSPSTPIGISTIGYLNGTTIENSIFTGGTATNLSLVTPTLRNAVFNGLSLFNDSVLFTGNVAINNLSATSSLFGNSTTTNAFIQNLTIGSSTAGDAFFVNATTTNLFATSSIFVNTYTDSLTVGSSTSATGNLTLNGGLTVNGTSTLATTTITSGTIDNLSTINSTTTNAYIDNLSVGTTSANSMVLTGTLGVIGTSTLATTTVTDFVASRATSTSFFSTLLTAVTGFFTDLVAVNATTTNFFAADSILTNATTTNLFTQNLAVGNASIQGNQSIDGTFDVTGTSTLGANVFLNGNVVIGTSSNEMLTINSLINSDIVPAANISYDIGSPSFYWRNAYVDNLTVNTISGTALDFNNTNSSTFTINNDNGTNDTEDSSFVFFRGLVTPNALFRWNSSTKRIESNMSFKIQDETPSVGSTTLVVKGGAGQGTRNLFQLVTNAGATTTVFSPVGWLGIGSTTPGSALTVLGNGYFGGDVTATGTLTVSGTTTLATSGGRVGIGTSTPQSTLHIFGTDGLIIPVGTTAQRSSSTLAGIIRYNTTNTTFEGFNGSTWGSLGGVIDTDLDTYVSAENTPGADNDELKFFTGGIQRAIISAEGLFGIGTSTPTSLLTVASSTATGASSLFSVGTTTTLFNILANGSVGIGTSSPADTLTINGGTITSTSSAINIVQSWNSANTVFTGIKSNITSLASGGSSLLVDLQLNGVSKFKVGQTGILTTNSLVTSGENNFYNGSVSDPAGGISSAAKIAVLAGAGNGVAGLASGAQGTAALNQNTYAGYFNNTSTVSGTGVNYGIYSIGTSNYFSGNIGIGTTTPGSKLSVQGNAYIGGNLTATGTLAVSGTTTLATTTVSALNASGIVTVDSLVLTANSAENLNGSITNIAGYTVSNNSAGFVARVLTNGVLAATANSVMIGNSSNGNEAQLNFGYNTPTVGLAYSSPGVLEVNSTVKGTFADLKAKNITASGASPIVNIANTGTGNYSNLFFSNTTGNAGQIWLNGSSQGGFGGANSLNIYTASAPITFMTNGTNERLRIDTAGNVGVGTTTPGSLLSVQGNTYIGGSLTATGTVTLSSNTSLRWAGSTLLNDSLSANTLIISTNSGAHLGYFSSGLFSIPSTSQMAWSAGGNPYNSIDTGLSRLGVATLGVGNGIVGNATGTLVAGAINASSSILTNASTTNLTVSNNAYFGGNTGIWNGSGNVGIGTTTPGYKLDVAGGYINVEKDYAYKYNGQNVITASTTLKSYFFGNAGTLSGTGDSNIGIGANVLTRLTSGAGNFGVGENALFFTTTGSGNIGLGLYALFQNTTGDHNIAAGYSSLGANTTGGYNIGLGLQAGASNTSGSQNIALGPYALQMNTIGSDNIALGSESGAYVSDASPNRASTYSVFLGYQTQSGAATSTNEIVIGKSAIGAGSNTVTLGNNSITKTILKGNIGIGTTTPTSLLTVASSTASGTSTLLSVGNTSQLFTVLANGNVGFGTASPFDRLANTSSNITDSVGTGVSGSGSSIAWAMNSPGYVQALYNGSTGGNSNGLLIKAAGTAASNKILAVETSASQTGGTDLFVVQGNGNVGIGTSTPVSPFSVNGGTVTVAGSLANFVQTWNSAATTFNGITQNIVLGVPLASSTASSKMFDFQENGTSVFYANHNDGGSAGRLSYNFLGSSIDGQTISIIPRSGVSGANRITGSTPLEIVPNGGVSFITTGTSYFTGGNLGIGTTTAGSLLAVASSTANGTASLLSVGTTTTLFNVLANGQAQFLNGSVSSPTIAAAGQTNTGIYFNSNNNELNITSAGALIATFQNAAGFWSRLKNVGASVGLSVGPNFSTITAPTGGAIFEANVGIGTTTPSAKLSVQDAYGGTQALFDVASTTSASYATSSLFKVLANGNVGIGNSNPTYKLSVVQSSLSNGSVVADFVGNNGSGFQVYTHGMVGINSISGYNDYAATINFNAGEASAGLLSGTFPNRNFALTTYNGDIYIQPGGLGGNTAAKSLIIKPGGNSATAFQVQNASSQTILDVDTTNGNVGISTTTPTSLLTVASSTATGGSSLFSIGTSTTLFNVLANGAIGIGTTTPAIGNKVSIIAKTDTDFTNGLYIRAGISGAGLASGLRVDAPDGTQGIRTQYNAFIVGNDQFQVNYSNGLTTIGGGSNQQLLNLASGFGAISKTATSIDFNAASTNDLKLFTSNTSNAVLLQPAGGSVGIGTSTPSSLLHVAGTTTIGIGNSVRGVLSLMNSSNLFSTSLRASSTQAANLMFTLPGTNGSSGNVLTSDGSGGMYWATAAAGGATTSSSLINIQTITANGTYTPTAGATTAEVVVTGAGGAGGSGGLSNTGGPGGGAGATAIVLVNLTGVSSVSVTVGTAGTGGAGAGGSGGSTVFGTYATSTGGIGGAIGQSGGNTAGGAGGTATGGSVNINGGSGATGGGTNATGLSSGNGGSSYWGGGGTASASGNTQAGNPGVAYGSGGSGSTGTANGGNGAGGVIVVYEYGNTTAVGTNVSGSSGQLQFNSGAGGLLASANLTWNSSSSSLMLGSASTTSGILSFLNSTNGYLTSLKASSTQTSDLTFTLPGTLGSSGNVLTSDGAGGMYWAAGAASTLGMGTTSVGTSTGFGNSIFTVHGTSTFVGTSVSPTALQVVGNIDNTSTSTYNPKVIGSVTTGASPRSIAVSGRYAYVASLTTGSVQIIDIGTPSAPVVVGTLTGGVLPRVAISGRYLYVVDSSTASMRIADVSNPSAPVTVATISTGLNQPISVSVSGRYAYVVNFGSNTMSVVDVSNPFAPVIVGTVTTASNPESVSVSGRYAYISAFGATSFQVIDISNPSSPAAVASLNTGSSNQNGFVSGNYAYTVSTPSAGVLRIVDISDPASPVHVGTATVGSTPQSVFVSGRYAYVTNSGSASMSVVDVASSTAPIVVGTVTTGSTPYSAVVSGRYAYVVNSGSASMQVIDIGGIESTSAIIHSLEAGTLQVLDNIFTQGNLSVGTGITIGNGGLFSSGAGSFSVATTSSLAAVSAISGILRDNSTNTVLDVLTLSRGSSGTAAANIGAGIAFTLQNASGNFATTSRISSIFTNPNSGSEGAALTFSTRTGGAALAERLRITQEGYLFVGTTTSVGSSTLLVQGVSGINPFNIASSTGASLLSVDQTGKLIAGNASTTGLTVTTNAHFPGTGIWNSSGNVGIGTTTPTGGKIVVNGSGDVAQFTSGSRSAIFALDSGGFSLFTGAAQTGNGLYASALSNYTALYANSAEKFRVDANGTNVVGALGASSTLAVAGQTTLATASSTGLTVSGNTYFGGNTGIWTSSGNIGIGTTSPIASLAIKGTGGTNPFVVASSTGSSLFTILQNGKVGIGSTSTPHTLVDIVGATGIAGANPAEVFITNGANSAGNAPNIIGRFGRSSVLGTYTATQGNDQLFFLGSRGYGSTTWGGQSTGAITFTASQNMTDASQGTYLSMFTTPNNSTTRAERLRITPEGYLFVGTSTSVGSSTLLVQGVSGINPFVVASSTGESLLTILQNGNVGIGTTTPANKLDVNGYLSFNSASTFVKTATKGILLDIQSGANDLEFLTASAGSGYGFKFYGASSDGTLRLASRSNTTTWSDLMAFTDPGNIGIGTTTPGSKLDIVLPTGSSDLNIFRLISNVGSQGNVVFRVDSDGDVFSEGGVGMGSPADLAEMYSALEAVDAGTIVAFGSSTISWNQSLENSTSTYAYDISGVRKAKDSYEAIGVISTRAGITLGGNTTNGVPVAFAGRVPVKVTTENGPVKRGDYLTVSAIMPGYAAKMTGDGKSIGRAISDYADGQDKVMMLVENGYQKVNMTSGSASTTSMLTSGNVDLNANGVAIINIKSLASANGSWSIDENGRIVARVLCLEDVCIDKTQLTNILNSTGQSGTVAGTSTASTGGTATTTPDAGETSTSTSPEVVVSETEPETPVEESPSVTQTEEPSAPEPTAAVSGPAPEEPAA